jgi:hypothetical protein
VLSRNEEIVKVDELARGSIGRFVPALDDVLLESSDKLGGD